jgi:hypothetical protein
MPKPKDPDEGRKERERRDSREQGRPEHGRRGEADDRYGEKDRPRRRRMGREHAVHQQIIERRLSGGAPATPEAYAKAIEEWQQLPGSIVRPPTDEKPSAKDTPEVKNQDAKEE